LFVVLSVPGSYHSHKKGSFRYPIIKVKRDHIAERVITWWSTGGASTDEKKGASWLVILDVLNKTTNPEIASKKRRFAGTERESRGRAPKVPRSERGGRAAPGGGQAVSG